MRILVVDDNPMNVMVVKEMLKRAGYRNIQSAESGMEMFQLLGFTEHGEEKPGSRPTGRSAEDSIPYDLVLLDMMMPGLDGIAICKIMQQHPLLRDLPIIMVTAIGDSKKLAEALDAGASDYVTKPINKIELLARIRVALRLKDQKDMHKERDRRLREELQLAREVQSAVLPAPLVKEKLEIGSIYCPSEELAGDLYAWYQIDQSKYGVAVIDAMGHGISSSLVCMFIASVLKDAMLQLGDPEQVIQELNRRALQLEFADQLIQYYFTAIYMVVDVATGTVEYVNSGHPPGIVLRRDGTTELLDGGSAAIGLFNHIEVKKQAIQVQPGDRLVLITDGILDMVDGDEEDKLSRLISRLLAADLDNAPAAWEAELLSDRHASNRSDDRCLVWISLK